MSSWVSFRRELPFRERRACLDRAYSSREIGQPSHQQPDRICHATTRVSGWDRSDRSFKRSAGVQARVTSWLELGAYLPHYILTRNRRFLIEGTKLRALFVLPNAAEGTFWCGVNFELSYNARHWEETRNALQIRPIAGWRFGFVDLILNPIMDLPFHGGPGALTRSGGPGRLQLLQDLDTRNQALR
jgi:hypothetical protein